MIGNIRLSSLDRIIWSDRTKQNKKQALVERNQIEWIALKLKALFTKNVPSKYWLMESKGYQILTPVYVGFLFKFAIPKNWICFFYGPWHIRLSLLIEYHIRTHIQGHSLRPSCQYSYAWLSHIFHRLKQTNRKEMNAKNNLNSKTTQWYTLKQAALTGS